MNQIPPYLDDGEPVFIKLAHRSKAPQKGNSAKEGPFYNVLDSGIQDHVDEGGNVGRVLRDDIIALDVDHAILKKALDDWPDTLVIESGGSDLGFHYYYRCPSWEPNQKELTAESKNIGSIRSGNSYCLCPPSIHDQSGDRYTVLNPRNPAEISVSRLSDLLESFSSDSANTGGGRRGGVGGAEGTDEPIPDEYPNRQTEWKTRREWLASNGFLSDLDKTVCQDWSGLEFKLAKCLAELGVSESDISDTLDRLDSNSKWHSRDSEYRNLTVQKAIEAACEDEFVEFDTIPNDGKESGSDLPEGKQNRSNMSGNDSTFTSKESVVEHNADGYAVQARLMEGTDGDTGEKFEYVDVATGSIQETETVDGETVEVPDIDDGPGQTSSLGTPEDLELKIKALQKLKEQIE